MPDGSFQVVPVQPDAEVDTFADQILITLRSDWLGFEAGSLLAAPALDFMRSGSDESRQAMLTPLFTPSPTTSLEGRSESRHFVILNVLDTVLAELRFWRYDKISWVLEQTYKGEGLQAISASGVDAEHSDDIWITSSGFTQPSSYSLAHATNPRKQARLRRELLKSLPAFYDSSGVRAEQLFATSADGTMVTPASFQSLTLRRFHALHLALHSQGAGWLERGCAYVQARPLHPPPLLTRTLATSLTLQDGLQANIRGGGEFGPKWHQAALKQNRHVAYEDFEAVARDLVSRGITSPEKLAVQGGSNGGLLTGNMLVRSPELFGAIVCQVPLLDMRRYHKLLAGASWMAEFGNPDSDWSFIQKYSPYHNLQPARAYPPILFTTSTRDDRVHPGHARKMVRKLVDLGLPAYYYENIEGGHGGAADNKQRAFMSVLAYSFLQKSIVTSVLGGRKATTAAIAWHSRGVTRCQLPGWAMPALAAASIIGFLVLQRSRH
ncbi:MAG: hypothetical protein SGPRY_002391 [Prymnesium sp.]